MLKAERFAVIGGNGNHDLDAHIIKVVNDLGYEDLTFMNLNMDSFPDSEEDDRIEEYEQLHNKHLILMQSMHRGKFLNEFLILAWAAKFQYGARSITGVVPFLRYRRQDHAEIPAEINRNAWVAHMLTACGVDRIILCDIHSPKTTDNLRQAGLEVWNVSPAPAFAAKLSAYVDMARGQGKTFFVYAPDKGSIARAIALARELNVEVMVTLKKRLHTGEVMIDDDPSKLAQLSADHQHPLLLASAELTGGNYVVIVDDELSTGSTSRLTGWHVRDNLQAEKVYCCVTHPVCAPGWKRKFVDKSPFDQIFFGNTIPRGYEKSSGGRITTVHVSQVIGNKLFEVMESLG